MTEATDRLAQAERIVAAAQELARSSEMPFFLAHKAITDSWSLIGADSALRARLAALSWEMCPQDGKRLRDALGEA